MWSAAVSHAPSNLIFSSFWTSFLDSHGASLIFNLATRGKASAAQSKTCILFRVPSRPSSFAGVPRCSFDQIGNLITSRFGLFRCFSSSLLFLSSTPFHAGRPKTLLRDRHHIALLGRTISYPSRSHSRPRQITKPCLCLSKVGAKDSTRTAQDGRHYTATRTAFASCILRISCARCVRAFYLSIHACVTVEPRQLLLS